MLKTQLHNIHRGSVSISAYLHEIKTIIDSLAAINEGFLDSLLKVSGCTCYPYLGDYIQDKLSVKSSKCTFIGYNSKHKGYRML